MTFAFDKIQMPSMVWNSIYFQPCTCYNIWDNIFFVNRLALFIDVDYFFPIKSLQITKQTYKM